MAGSRLAAAAAARGALRAPSAPARRGVAAAASSGRGGSQSVSAARSFLRELRDIREEREQPASGAAPGGADPLQFQTPLDVVLYPHPVLRAKNAPVRDFDARLEALAEEMFHVMYKTDGVGLSAPQVGVNARLMVYNPEGDPKRGEEFVLCNPKITKASPETDFMDEGCLSFPGIFGEVEVRAPPFPPPLSLPPPCPPPPPLHPLRREGSPAR